MHPGTRCPELAWASRPVSSQSAAGGEIKSHNTGTTGSRVKYTKLQTMESGKNEKVNRFYFLFMGEKLRNTYPFFQYQALNVPWSGQCLAVSHTATDKL